MISVVYLQLVVQSIRIDENQSDRLNLLIIDLHRNVHEVQLMFDKQSTEINSDYIYECLEQINGCEHTRCEQLISLRMVIRDKARCIQEFGRRR